MIDYNIYTYMCVFDFYLFVKSRDTCTLVKSSMQARKVTVHTDIDYTDYCVFISPGKLISIFTVCGALAADCVSQGHTDFLPVILDCFEESCTQASLGKYLKCCNGWVRSMSS